MNVQRLVPWWGNTGFKNLPASKFAGNSPENLSITEPGSPPLYALALNNISNRINHT